MIAARLTAGGYFYFKGGTMKSWALFLDKNKLVAWWPERPSLDKLVKAILFFEEITQSSAEQCAESILEGYPTQIWKKVYTLEKILEDNVLN